MSTSSIPSTFTLTNELENRTIELMVAAAFKGDQAKVNQYRETVERISAGAENSLLAWFDGLEGLGQLLFAAGTSEYEIGNSDLSNIGRLVMQIGETTSALHNLRTNAESVLNRAWDRQSTEVQS